MMQPLLALALALVVARFDISRAAPQPLALSNSTDSVTSADNKLTSVDEKILSHTTNVPSDASEDEDDPKSDSPSPSTIENSSILNSESASDIDKITDTLQPNTQDSTPLMTRSVTNSDITESSDADPDVTSARGDAPEASASEGITFESEIPDKTPISRYVPPLDPMKHMFMMAEVKRQLEVSTTELNSEFSTEATTLDSQDIKTTTANISTDATDGEKDTEDFVEVRSDDGPELILSAAVTTNDTEKVSTETGNEVTENPHENDKLSTFTQETTSIATTALPIIENHESNDTTANITHESSLLIKSSELFSGKGDFKEANDSSSTIESTSISDSTESFVVFSSTSSSTSTDIPKITTTISSTTAAEDIELNEEPSLVRSYEETIPEDSENDRSSISEKDISTEKHDETTEEASASTESTTLIEETDPTLGEELEKLSAFESEDEKDLNLTNSFKFNSDELLLNASNVIYSEATPDSSDKSIDEEIMDSETPEPASELNDVETTTASILTTIKELIFPSTTTETPPREISDALELEFISKEESEITTDSSTPGSTNVGDNLTEPEIILKDTSPELLKVELLKSDVDIISRDEEGVTTSATIDIESKPSTEDNDQIQDESVPQNSSNSILDELKISVENLGIADIGTDSHTTDLPETTEGDSHKTEAANASDSEEISGSSESQPETTTEVEKAYLYNYINSQDRYVSGNNTDTVAAVQFLHYHDKASSEQCFKLVDAHWNYATNLTEENKKKQLEQTLEYSLFHKGAWKNATSFAWKSFNDTLLRRWFKSLSVLGTAALPEEKLNEFNRLKAEMKNTYSTAKVCPYLSPNDTRSKPEDCSLTLEPDLHRILTKSRDYDELTHVWKAWRDAAGKPIREKYLRFVNLSNEAATLNGFPDTGDMWREAYESNTFQMDLERLWEQLKPLYQHLHAYVRRKLIGLYGKDKIKDDGPIPAHLFGNMWAQSWVSLMDIAQPFPGKPSVDVTPIMEAKNLTALEMFKISEEFFTSLGLKEMPDTFWKRSLIEKPKDREIICHASAWDFCNGRDYRIKQCTDITMEDLITVHHEMGHIQYFLQYARQPNVFREGANPGFHEAIGDVLALSVSTPKHLKSIGLLEEVADDPEGDLNFLLRTALDKVSFLPSGYLIDLWRWGLFSGEIQPEEMNTEWWNLRLKYQGICPPVKRHDTDFDPGAKYHVPGNVPYIRYFVSFVIQFQFHKVLCDAAGHAGPLYKCDIYRSKEAGQILSQVMELGSSEHWSEAMKIMTGGATNRMDAGPILEYFQPLLTFLEEQNRNETLGWRSENSMVCP